MTTELITGIVRTLNRGGAPAGAGFVVIDDGLIATCALVEATRAGLGDTVCVVFHATGEERQTRVDPEWWRTSDVEDVDGMWGYGNFSDATTVAGQRVLQLTGIAEVTLGFSGAPALDTVTRLPG